MAPPIKEFVLRFSLLIKRPLIHPQNRMVFVQVHTLRKHLLNTYFYSENSVVDPDPYVFGASSIRIHHYLYGSEFFHHHVCDFFMTYLWRFWRKTYPSKSKKQTFLKTYFLLTSWKPLTKRAGSGSVTNLCGPGSMQKCHGSTILCLCSEISFCLVFFLHASSLNQKEIGEYAGTN